MNALSYSPVAGVRLSTAAAGIRKPDRQDLTLIAAESLEGMAADGLALPPAAGRPSIWGLPFSGTPIQFDNLLVTPAK